MGWKNLLPWRKTPVLTRRIRARSYSFVPASRPYETTKAAEILIGKIERNRAAYETLCREIVNDRARLEGLSARERSHDNPNWVNDFIPPLDGMILYTLTRLLRPATYLEIGSGNSTKFVRKAIRDHRLQTRIVSIDPRPRAEIDGLCDKVVRARFQDIAGEAASWVAPGDMIFQDGSHHIQTNTDATVFFTEFLPIAARGITYGIHDIFLPRDYPANWHRRFYNEQYLFLAYLLAGAAGDEIVFPVAFVSQDDRLSGALAGIFDLPALEGTRPSGGAFWMRRP